MEKSLNQNLFLGDGIGNHPSYSPILASDRLPDDLDKKYMWLDSTGIVKIQEFASFNEVETFLGWGFDSWVDTEPVDIGRAKALENCDPIEVLKDVYDIAPERHEIIQTN